MARQIRLPRLSDPPLRRPRAAPARPGHRERRDGAAAVIAQRRRGSALAGAATVEEAALREAVANLATLDLAGLRLQWRNVFGGSAPVHLPKPLLARILAYRLQANAFGDLPDALKSASPDFTAMRRLAMRFRGILRSKDIQKFGAWLNDAQQSGIYAMQRFARTLRRDLDAVTNALTEGWGNGQAEGHINRLKTLKRAMYGRASTELLRARMLPLHLPIQHGK